MPQKVSLMAGIFTVNQENICEEGKGYCFLRRKLAIIAYEGAALHFLSGIFTDTQGGSQQLMLITLGSNTYWTIAGKSRLP